MIPGIVQSNLKFEAETRSLLARFTVKPNGRRQTLINKTIKDLKTAGIWDKLSVLYFLNAFDRQSSKLNWLSSTYDITETVLPKFIANDGMEGNGTSSYLETNFVPSEDAKYLQNDATVFVKFKTPNAAVQGKFLYGACNADTTSKQISYCPNQNGARQTVIMNSPGHETLSFVVGVVSEGNITMMRNSATTLHYYLNKAAGVEIVFGTSTKTTGTIPLLASNFLGSIGNFSNNRINCFAAGGALTETEIYALNDIVDYYSLNANPAIAQNVIVIGDSTIAAYASQTAVSAFLGVTGTLTNVAVPGDSINEQLADYNALSSGVKSAANIVFVQIGLNDVDPSETAATAMARYQTLIDTIATNSPSAKIYACTMINVRERLIDVLGEVDGEASYQKCLLMNESIKGKGSFPITGTYGQIFKHTDLLSDSNGNLIAHYDTGDHVHETSEARSIIAACWKEYL